MDGHGLLGPWYLETHKLSNRVAKGQVSQQEQEGEGTLLEVLALDLVVGQVAEQAHWVEGQRSNDDSLHSVQDSLVAYLESLGDLLHNEEHAETADEGSGDSGLNQFKS